MWVTTLQFFNIQNLLWARLGEVTLEASEAVLVEEARGWCWPSLLPTGQLLSPAFLVLPWIQHINTSTIINLFANFQDSLVHMHFAYSFKSIILLIYMYITEWSPRPSCPKFDSRFLFSKALSEQVSVRIKHLGKWKFTTPLQTLHAVRHSGGMHKNALFKGCSTLVAMVTTTACPRPGASYKNVAKKGWNVYFSISS